MSEKIVAIVGSYRKGEIIDTAVEAILKGVREKGATTHTIYLTEQHIECCRNCRTCAQKPGIERGKCPKPDDMEPILPEIEDGACCLVRDAEPGDAGFYRGGTCASDGSQNPGRQDSQSAVDRPCGWRAPSQAIGSNPGTSAPDRVEAGVSYFARKEKAAPFLGAAQRSHVRDVQESLGGKYRVLLFLGCVLGLWGETELHR